MEVALVEWGAARLPSELRERLDFLPFSAERMRVSSLHRDDEGFVLYAKGALQTILPRCIRWTTRDGSVPSTTPGDDATLRPSPRWGAMGFGCSLSPIATSRNGSSATTWRNR